MSLSLSALHSQVFSLFQLESQWDKLGSVFHNFSKFGLLGFLRKRLYLVVRLGLLGNLLDTRACVCQSSAHMAMIHKCLIVLISICRVERCLR